MEGMKGEEETKQINTSDVEEVCGCATITSSMEKLYN
jgi:hypothetical protein